MSIARIGNEQWPPATERPQLELIQGKGKSDPFEQAAAFVYETGGDQFWGSVRSVDGVAIPQTLINRLDTIRHTYGLITPEALNWRDEDWMNREGLKSKQEMRKLLGRCSIELPARHIPEHPQAPRTNIDGYLHDKLRTQTLATLTADDFVPAVVHNMFANYRTRINPDERSDTLGRSALMHFLFEAGGNPVLNAFKKQNRVLHNTPS